MGFADFKATIGTRINEKVPDMVRMTTAGGLRIVGEIKVPWVHDHQLANTLTGGGKWRPRYDSHLQRISATLWQKP